MFPETPIISSIVVDRQVNQWFCLLITRLSVQNELQNDEEAKRQYIILKQNLWQIYSTILLFSISIFVFLSVNRFWGGLLTLFLFYILSIFNKTKTRSVAELSKIFLSREFPSSTSEKLTLYEICEILSQKYHIPSLVDTIALSDKIFRFVIIGTFVFTGFIYPLKPWQVFASLPLAHYFCLSLLGTPLILKYLK